MGCTKSKSVISSTSEHLVNPYQLRPSDLIFFSGKPNTKLADSWVHMGLVVYMPNLYPHCEQMLLEFGTEFTDNLENQLTQKSTTDGMRLVNLRQRLASSDAARIAVRSYQYSPADGKDQEAREEALFLELANLLQRPIPTLPASYQPFYVGRPLSTTNLPGRVLNRMNQLSNTKLFDSQTVQKIAVAKVENFSPLARIK